MSFHAVSWVLRHSSATLGARLVLIVLADHAKDDGTYAWPSVQTIAQQARLSRRQTIRALQLLERQGAICRRGTSTSGTVIYDLQMGGVDMSRGDICDANGVVNVTQTVIERSERQRLSGGMSPDGARAPSARNRPPQELFRRTA